MWPSHAWSLLSSPASTTSHQTTRAPSDNNYDTCGSSLQSLAVTTKEGNENGVTQLISPTLIPDFGSSCPSELIHLVIGLSVVDFENVPEHNISEESNSINQTANSVPQLHWGFQTVQELFRSIRFLSRHSRFPAVDGRVSSCSLRLQMISHAMIGDVRGEGRFTRTVT